jgi:hypothetical protein
MENHRDPGFVDRHAVVLDMLVVFAPTVANVGDMLVFLDWEDDFTTEKWWPVFTMAFLLFPSLVAFVINWWHPAPTATFRPFLAAVPQLLVVPLIWMWAEWDADRGFGVTEAEMEEVRVATVVFGSILGLILTMPAVLAGYMGTWLGHWSRRGKDAP